VSNTTSAGVSEEADAAILADASQVSFTAGKSLAVLAAKAETSLV